MDQGPPARPQPIAHAVKLHGKLLIFNDSWAANPTAETMQLIEILISLMNQGLPAPPHPIAHKMKMHGKSLDFQWFLGRQGRPPHRRNHARAWKSLYFQ